MKKLILAIATLTTTLSFGQWVNKTVNNDFDAAYRIAYNRSSDGSLLKLEDADGELAFYIQNAYTCTEMPVVDVVFIFSDGTKESFQFTGATSDDRETVFFTPDILVEPYLNAFKRSSRVKIRVNDTFCASSVFEFNMSGSSSAVSFMTK